MEENTNYEPSEVELEILQVLWEHQPATVRTVHEMICAQREVGYTTILTFLQRMTKKEIVQRFKKGKTHYYRAVPKESEVQQTMFQKLLQTAYRGSAMKLVLHALGQKEVKAEELEKLQQWLEAKKKESDD